MGIFFFNFLLQNESLFFFFIAFLIIPEARNTNILLKNATISHISDLERPQYSSLQFRKSTVCQTAKFNSDSKKQQTILDYVNLFVTPSAQFHQTHCCVTQNQLNYVGRLYTSRSAWSNTSIDLDSDIVRRAHAEVIIKPSNTIFGMQNMTEI